MPVYIVFPCYGNTVIHVYKYVIVMNRKSKRIIFLYSITIQFMFNVFLIFIERKRYYFGLLWTVVSLAIIPHLLIFIVTPAKCIARN